MKSLEGFPSKIEDEEPDYDDDFEPEPPNVTQNEIPQKQQVNPQELNTVEQIMQRWYNTVPQIPQSIEGEMEIQKVTEPESLQGNGNLSDLNGK